MTAGRAGRRLLMARLGLIAAFLAVWEGVVRLRMVDPFFTSRPSAIFASFADGVASGDLVRHTAVTSLEMLLGWALGGALGIASGFLLAKFEFLNQVLDPIMYALNGLPRVALAPLFIIWFGIGFGSKIAIGVSIVYFICVFATYGGIRSVDQALVDAVRVLGGSEIQVSRKIVGEFIGARSGVGYYIAYSAGLFDTAGVFAGIFVLMLMAAVLNELIKVAERRLLRWRPPLPDR